MSSPLSKPRNSLFTVSKLKAGGGALLLALTLFLAGCSHSGHGQMQALDDAPRRQQFLESVPFYPQDAYQCGPASLAMVLAWSGRSVDMEALTLQVYSPALKGSLQPALIAGARRNGRVAYVVNGLDALMREIAAGHPVVVLQNLGLSWLPLWHYAVAIGYDTELRVIRLHSGHSQATAVSIETFLRTWKPSAYWGLLVLPPSRLPATAGEDRFVEAAVGLERAGQFTAAADAYRAALDAWPDSWAAHIGLGNSCYATAQLDCAESAFREAVLRFPNDGVAYNNLANVLCEQGRVAEALDAARQAVEIGGPLQDQFMKTLKEIEAKIL
jgi:tetratricopeptide (TPR) repeat protein